MEFEFEQATDEAGLPLPYNVIAYVDEPEADTYYFWTFGDGMESDEPDPTHVYEEVGNYEVCLTVTEVMGNVFTCTAVYCDTLMIDMDGLVRQRLTLNVLFTGQTLNSVAEQDLILDVHPNPLQTSSAFKPQPASNPPWCGRWTAVGSVVGFPMVSRPWRCLARGGRQGAPRAWKCALPAVWCAAVSGASTDPNQSIDFGSGLLL